MKTRKRNKIQKKIYTKRKSVERLSPQVLNLIDEYWDLVVEYQTKQDRFKQAFKDSIKWKKFIELRQGCFASYSRERGWIDISGSNVTFKSFNDCWRTFG